MVPMMSAKVFVTIKVQVQLKAVATEAADPLILPGKISPSINPKFFKLTISYPIYKKHQINTHME